MGNANEHLGPLLTVSEVARELRVSEMTVYRLINAGEMPAIRVGKSYRIDRDELGGYLRRGLDDIEQTRTGTS